MRRPGYIREVSLIQLTPHALQPILSVVILKMQSFLEAAVDWCIEHYENSTIEVPRWDSVRLFQQFVLTMQNANFKILIIMFADKMWWDLFQKPCNNNYKCKILVINIRTDSFQSFMTEYIMQCKIVSQYKILFQRLADWQYRHQLF